MVVCPGCGVPVKDMNKASEHLDWRQQVHETVERHKAKRRRERARIDDEARQLSIFPEDSDEDEGEQLARKRRAEIRARVEEKLARRQTPAPESPVSDAGEVSIPSEEDSFGAANPGLELERGLGETRLDTTTAEFVESRSDARFRDHNAALELNESPLADEPLLSRPEQSGDLGGTPLMGLATAAERVLGGFIDVGFVSLIQLTLFYLTTHLVAQRIGALPATAIAAMSLVGAVLGAGYFLFFWSLSGQTLGKLLTGNSRRRSS